MNYVSVVCSPSDGKVNWNHLYISPASNHPCQWTSMTQTRALNWRSRQKPAQTRLVNNSPNSLPDKCSNCNSRNWYSSSFSTPNFSTLPFLTPTQKKTLFCTGFCVLCEQPCPNREEFSTVGCVNRNRTIRIISTRWSMNVVKASFLFWTHLAWDLAISWYSWSAAGR